MKKNKTLPEEKIKKINEDPNWVNAKRYNYDLKTMISRFPEGCPDRVIANVLGLSDEELQSKYLEALVKLRKSMGVVDEE